MQTHFTKCTHTY